VTEISVIVPALNAAATLGDTLEALAVQDLDEPFEVIVVDNGSDDDTAALAENSPGPVSVIRKERGRAGSARNRGAEAARAGSLAFTDADCVPAPGWLRAGLGALRDADLVQGAVRPDPRSPLGPFDRTVWVVAEAGLYETANLFVSRETFMRVGGFEDRVLADISAPFGEDVWFGWKARRAGARSTFCEQALVHHAVFRRGPPEYVSERLRARHFPALAAEIPELRREFFFGRLFLTRRSAAFDAGLAGALTAVALRSPLPLLAAAPYAWMTGRRAARFRRARVAAVDLVADAATLAALLWGSARARALVI
jgi:glycosyltransferase involved in cell wall biosynthesis